MNQRHLMNLVFIEYLHNQKVLRNREDEAQVLVPLALFLSKKQVLLPSADFQIRILRQA